VVFRLWPCDFSLLLFGEFRYIFTDKAIVNRVPLIAQPQLITDYFPSNSWYVIIVNLSFVIVAMVTIPNFLNVSM
jgi:hypothetical protein